MSQTNASVTIVRRTKDWEGNVAKSTVGTYKVWNEERKSTLLHQYRRDLRGFVNELEESKGMFFLFSDVDLTDTLAVIDGSSFSIFSWDRHIRRQKPSETSGAFKHIEAFYK